MSEQRSVPCINWPCTKGAGHAGPCGTSSKEQLAEILSDAHAIHCAAEVGMPCDCRVPDAIAELLRRAEPPPSRIGPTEPDDTMVICPVCTSQFRAIPLDVQRVRDELLAVAKRYAAECRLCGGHGVRRRLDLDGTPLDDVSCEQCANVAHTTAPLQAEIEALRAEVERLNRILGRLVEGDGDSNLTIRAGTDAFAARPGGRTER